MEELSRCMEDALDHFNYVIIQRKMSPSGADQVSHHIEQVLEQVDDAFSTFGERL